MTQADSVYITPPTNTPVDPTRRFETLKDAEDALMEQGFKLVPDTCNWIDDAAQIDAGVYPVEEAYGVSKYRIEYRALDATRRRFLFVAAFASVAGAGSLAAAAMAPNDVPQAVTVPHGSPSHRLRAAIRELAAAHDTLIAAQATNEEAEAMWTDWEVQNPEPASKRGRRRWIRRAEVDRHAMVAQPWQDLMTAEGVFVAAQDAVANIPIAGIADVQAMAACSVAYDAVLLARRNSDPIARVVALHYFRLGSAVPS